MPEKYDAETSKILSEGELLQDMIRGDGWAIVKRKLTEMISMLDSIKAIPDDIKQDPVKMSFESRVREGAASILETWLKDIEGTAEQTKQNRETMEKKKDNEIIHREP